MESSEDERADVTFASVWVKVEVQDKGDEDEDWTEDGEPDVNPILETRPTRKRKKPGKELKCTQCEYTTVYKNCYQAHLMGHNQAKPFTCHLCDYKSKYSTSLHRHLRIKHNEELPPDTKKPEKLKCNVCDYTTYFKWNLNGHKRKHLREKKYKCEQCEFETSYHHNLKKHNKVHVKLRNEEHFKCDKCPFSTKHKGHIHRHLAVIHHEIATKSHPCEFCGFSTLERWRLNLHKQRSKQKEPLKCVHCSFQTEYSCEMKKHKYLHYGAAQLNVVVANEMSFKKVEEVVDEPPEDAIVNNLEQIELHKREMQKEIETEINQVDTVQHQPDNHSQTHNYTLDPECLDWHSIQVLESEDKDKPFQCHMCSYTSKFKASVQRHFQRRHTDSKNRPYKCVNCDFSTKTKDQISLHNKRSQSDVLLYCNHNDCSYTTNFKCQFVMHQKSHNMYRCSACNYTSRQKYDLNKHYSTVHMGNGLKCQYCSFVALRKDTLAYHLTIHTGERPFRCKLCEYKASRRSLLENHVLRYHRESLNPEGTVVDEERIESLRVSNVDSGTFLNDEVDPVTGKPYIVIRPKERDMESPTYLNHEIDPVTGKPYIVIRPKDQDINY